MDNQEDVKILDQENEEIERENKQIISTGCAFTICTVFFAIASIIILIPLSMWGLMYLGVEDPWDFVLPLGFILSPIVGGIIGFLLSKKWWGVILGIIIIGALGFLLTPIIYVFVFHMFSTI
ncbi:MAG: hypothetical protein PVF83_02185 [Anaerolineales bacterium]|jgi:hypothetical protein